MKKIRIILLLLFMPVYMAMPLFSGEIKQVKDPISDSFIINSLEMETDTAPDQDTEAGQGDIIFDNTFNEPSTGKIRDKEIYRNSGEIISRLRSKDKRWHIIRYKVKRNESAWIIAKKFDVEPSVIIELNQLNKKGNLAVNQVILVPSKKGIYYKIQKGDTLSGIAVKFKTDIENIAEVNNISGADIRRGKNIFIPDAVEVKTSVSVKKKTDKTEIAGVKKETGGKSKNKKQDDSSKIVMSWPVRGPVTSGFGNRKDPFSGSGTRRFHCGMDIGAEIGTPVKAACEGRVIFSGWKGSYGYMVVIAHRNNYITVYAHNSKNLVETGEVVERGQVIALTGNTGAVTGAHLHFEIRKGTVPLNPQRILKK